MADIEVEIESRMKRIGENEAHIAEVVRKLWNPDQTSDLESLRQQELQLRQQNVILRREIADLKLKMGK